MVISIFGTLNLNNNLYLCSFKRKNTFLTAIAFGKKSIKTRFKEKNREFKFQKTNKR